ncbi:hypothetical protein PHMEG_00035272 [Phytophthora megakarya]|uniref:Uncharacterized protein n=1 Tax=Phytophthora megakarya TaxID=4795 RepID=A0A225UNR7_9STRA|nr:hypothetical protein PHMEG_00035272 [Phytophthora megakarya]
MPKDPQVSRSEVGKPRSKTLRMKMKAPEYEEDGDQDGSGWSVEDLKYLYHRKELRDFVCQDPVMKILKLKRIAKPKDPIQAADSGSDSSDGSDGSDSEMDSNRRIYLAANQEAVPKEESETIMPDPGHQDPGSMNHIHQEH